MSKENQHINYDDLIVKVLLKEASVDEKNQLNDWVNSSLENRQTFNASKTAFNISTPVPKLNVEAAWEKMNSRIEPKTNTPQAKVISMPWINQVASIAAVLIVAISVWWFVGDNAPQQLEIMASNGVTTVNLSDGSVVKLSEGSSLKYAAVFDGAYRDVTLAGEAFFDVAPNKGQPFIIHTPQEAEIKVVGTSFSVRANLGTDEVEVVVETGKVILTEDYENIETSPSVNLVPGEKGVYNKKEAKAEKSLNLNPKFLYWLNKTLIFRKTDINTVVEVLNEIYDADIALKDDKLNACRITATFRNENLRTILTIIGQTLDLEVTNENNKFILEGDGC